MASAPTLEFLPPRLDARVLAVARRLLPFWLRRRGLGRIEVEGLEGLQRAMQRFEAGELRLLLAFRHPSVDDPAVLAHLVWHRLRPAGGGGRRAGAHPAHVHFLYDRGIPLWAGPWVGWLLPRLGGCSIQRGSLDLPALRTARSLLLEGAYPLAVAPEGATNGHSEVLSPLEPGVAQLALWTADDLARAQRPEATEVLPIGVQYSFTGPVWPAIERLLRQLEAEAGLPPAGARCLDPEALYGRLLRLGERMLTAMEGYYRRAHPALASGIDPGAALEPRLQQLLHTALRVGERALAVEAHGDLSARCRRLEHAGWERLYPAQGAAALATAPAPASATSPAPSRAAVPPCPLERGLAQQLAADTERALWHMRLVESFVAVSGHHVRECPSPERFADTLLILRDTLGRLQDRRGAPGGARPQLGPRRVTLRIGAPLAVTPRLEAYRADRRGAVAQLTAELQSALEGLIQPSGSPPASRAR